jgi:hypothetical protein
VYRSYLGCTNGGNGLLCGGMDRGWIPIDLDCDGVYMVPAGSVCPSDSAQADSLSSRRARSGDLYWTIV